MGVGWMLSSFFYVLLLIVSVFAHNKTHDCIHDKISHQISQQYVKYNDHPLESGTIPDTNKRRSLSAQYEPIRIRPYYDPLLINRNTLAIDKILHIKQLVSASINYVSQFVKVIPIGGPLFINRCQRIRHDSSFTYNVCPLSDYKQQLKCQYATIPEKHIAESWYYDPITLKSTKYKDAGTGIADVDLVIYVTQTNNQCATDGTTFAWTSICNLDQFGRPIAGTINFCAAALDNKYWKFDVAATLHEIMHILVMSNELFPYFYNLQTAQFHGIQNVIKTSGSDSTYIITNSVKQISQSHFGCDTLIGAPLENNGDTNATVASHWDSKYLQSELMCGSLYSAVLYVSKFTFALMEDSGWYNIDYEYADIFQWGFHQGCDFFTNDCYYYPQFYCTSPADNGCSYDYTTVADCVNVKPTLHDYCAIKIPHTDPIYTDFESICWDVRGKYYVAPSTQYQGVTFGINSRCVEINNGVKYLGKCFEHECIRWNSINKWYAAVKIKINDGSINNAETITCLRNDATTWKESMSYGVNIKCPNIDTICGNTLQPFSCYWGYWNINLNKCICSVGYIGNDCSISYKNILASEAIAAPVVVNNNNHNNMFMGVCISNATVRVSINGHYRYDGEYEGIASYVHDINLLPDYKHYLFYSRYHSQWTVAAVKGDSSMAYCRTPLPLHQIMSIDIQNCKLWVISDSRTNEWIYDFGFSIYICSSPPTLPTISTTNSPTKQSIHPTADPTDFPTDNPTTDPTKNPIYSSIQPTHNPILIPPTYIPTPPTYDPITPTYNRNPPTYNYNRRPRPTIAIPTLTPTVSSRTNNIIMNINMSNTKLTNTNENLTVHVAPSNAPTNSDINQYIIHYDDSINDPDEDVITFTIIVAIGFVLLLASVLIWNYIVKPRYVDGINGIHRVNAIMDRISGPGNSPYEINVSGAPTSDDAYQPTELQPLSTHHDTDSCLHSDNFDEFDTDDFLESDIIPDSMDTHINNRLDDDIDTTPGTTTYSGSIAL